MTVPLKRQSIVPRMDSILRDIERLRKFTAISRDEFARNADSFDIAKARLREALEGVFHIGAHILARLNGGRVTEYKEIARKLGEYAVVDKEFADVTLVQMAGYRNRLTHFYADIASEELYDILQNHLNDFETFLGAIKRVLEHPEQFNIRIE
ncbi:MAG: hypothetical protein G01um101466_410 [Parcubacteria group bacterium Gr01-1014_66]|nr:MAG: hypothetical protein G01um101466_410 [Parcubacteria group bacterium Gr01-1014_66]